MSEFGHEILTEVVAAIESHATEIAAALTRTLDAPIEVSPGETGTWESSTTDVWQGPGLLAVARVEEQALIFALAESSGLIPMWCQSPDEDGIARLQALAKELADLILPAPHAAGECHVIWVPLLSAAIEAAQIAAGMPLAAIRLTSGAQQGILHAIWPAQDPDAALSSSSGGLHFGGADEHASLANHGSHAGGGAIGRGLPPYTRSLLRIKVPVTVTLASSKQRAQDILELVPGSIIQFEKACDELLELEVGSERVALGEAVKVGDKFGIRVHQIVLPSERFLPVRRVAKLSSGTRS